MKIFHVHLIKKVRNKGNIEYVNSKVLNENKIFNGINSKLEESKNIQL